MADFASRSEELDAKLAELPIEKQVEAIAQAGQKSRRTARIALAGLVLDLVISLGLGWQWQRTEAAQDDIAKNAQTAYDTCIASNKTRADQVNLWRFVLKLSAQDVEEKTPAEIRTQAQQTREFLSFVAKTFAPRDCNKVKT